MNCFICFWKIIDREGVEKAPPFIAVFILYATILEGPVALLRYMYPIMICVPLLLGDCFCIKMEQTQTIGEEHESSYSGRWPAKRNKR